MRTVTIKYAGREIGQSLINIAEHDLKSAILIAKAEGNKKELEALRVRVMGYSAEIEAALFKMAYPNIKNQNY